MKTKPEKGLARGSKAVVTANSNRDLLVLLLFIMIVVFALYLAAAFIIHLFTWASDQSLVWADLWVDNEVRAENWMGTFGATLSAMCVSRGFGVAALFLPLMVAMLSVLVLGVKVKHYYRRILMLAVGMVLLSVGLGYLFGSAAGYLGSGLGGDFGFFVSRWLIVRMGFPLTGVLLAVVTLGYLMWVSSGFNQWVYTRANRDAGKAREVAERLLGGKPRAAVHAGGESEGAGDTAEGDSSSGDGVQGDAPDANAAGGAPAGGGHEVDAGGEDGIPTEIVDCEEEVFAAQDDVQGQSVRGETEREGVMRPESSKQEEADRDVYTLDDPEEQGEGEAVSSSDSEKPGRDEGKGEREAEMLPEDAIATTVERVAPVEPASVGCYTADGRYDPSLELPGYQFPPLDLLDDHSEGQQKSTSAELIAKRAEIIKSLRTYNIEIANIKIIQGPTVTLYEVVLKKGILIKRIKSLEDDIAMSLSALSVRIIAPIPGRGTVGIEVPNEHPSVVSMKSVLSSSIYEQSKAILPVAIGRTISNQVYVFDLAKMPHLLVAGATGQGKSVGLNALIASLLYRKHPSQLKFVFIDPKKVELSLYAKIERHYLAKMPGNGDAIITDVDLVVETLTSLCNEMDNRYELLKDAMVRNIEEYNEKFVSGRLDVESGHRYLPYIVVVIDEYADLIMTAGRDVEQPIARLAQLARAIGIHLVIATQRPTANIITGVIKANFPARIAFRVSSAVDSRTILDQSGANQLIGRGDMLISTGTDLVRLQCAFLDMPELERITDFIGNQRGYESAYLLPDAVGGGIEELSGGGSSDLSDRDALFEDIAHMVVDEGRCSTSAIQRKYSIGYNRAGRIVDQLEAAGIVGTQDASKPRTVLVSDKIALERLLAELS